MFQTALSSMRAPAIAQRSERYPEYTILVIIVEMFTFPSWIAMFTIIFSYEAVSVMKRSIHSV